MTNREREINALIQLLDDTDTEVLVSVEQRLLTYGESVIPTLEDYWEQQENDLLQDRIEMLIHRIHFDQLKIEFANWANGESDLLYGSFLVAKYQYPELQSLQTIQEIERIRRNIWLEMNSYLTPLEQIKIMQSILFGYYKMKGGELAYNQPNDYMIHKVVEAKKGNALTNGILYLILAEQLDLPVRALQIPRQFVLGWFSHQVLFDNDFSESHPAEKIKFYIDPNSGAGFQQKDIELYLKRISVPSSPHFFMPQSNRQIIKLLLEQFSLCFDNEQYGYKKNELEQLIAIIDG
ncbi:MAG TPA: transglutaminase family protein [Phnomibacter sp.]|nr:transglutaminase family protein [Phnomibacter sp.]